MIILKSLTLSVGFMNEPQNLSTLLLALRRKGAPALADGVTLMSKWFEDIKDDPNLKVTDQDIAYMTFAATQYGFYGIKTDLGEMFGSEFRGLNMCMPNIYGQIDNMKGFDPKNGKYKYDSEKVKELAAQGKTAKEICKMLGYPEDRAKSLTSNKGWIEGRKLLSENAEECTESTDSVYDAEGERSENLIENTEIVQKQTESTDLYRSVKFEF